ncbi:MAG TPA: flagellar M-ring protein FliF, partial [Novosphingobium sp.]|nr:flagellar M-ring protein FliF [Novosphingobium sp.]
PPDKQPFYETPWFASLLHYGVPLLGVLMVLLLGVRPLIKAVKGPARAPSAAAAQPAAAGAAAADSAALPPREMGAAAPLASEEAAVDASTLERQVSLAQGLVRERPDSAVIALRQMLQPAETEPTP